VDADKPLSTLPGVEDILRQGAVWAELPDGLEARVLAGLASSGRVVLRGEVPPPLR
jgi:hypothetical protein